MDSIDRVKLLIAKEELLHKDDRIVVGVSGGADSVCLLLLLREIITSDNIIAVHINHGIRGEEAKRDEKFVEQLCEKYNILLEIRHLNVPFFALENKISEEEAGRILRYKAFEEIRHKEKGTKIAVAHNANDVAETFLLNLSRGSGITGLAGIKIKNDNIIRPLIRTSRAEIEEIVKFYEESFIVDSTNNSLIYARNRIRNKVLPELFNINDGTIRHINEAADKLRKIEGYVLRESEEAYKIYVNLKEGIYIDLDLSKTDEVIQEEVIHRVLAEAAGRTRDIGGVHIESVKELFYKQVGRCISLPHGVMAYRDYKGIKIINKAKTPLKTENKKKLPELKQMLFEIDKISDISIEDDNIVLTFCDGSTKNLLQNSCIKWFDYDKISNNVLLRYRKDGDYLVISDKGTEKKLKKYFIDSKVPLEKRDAIPLVAVDNEILWIIGYRTGEGAKITKETRRILKIEIKENDGGKDGSEDYYITQ